MSKRDLLTVKQAAELLQVSDETVRVMVRRGDIAAVRFGPRTIRIPWSAIVPADYEQEREHVKAGIPPFGLPPGAASTRLNHALLREGYRSRDDLMHVSDTDLSDVQGVGRTLLALAIDWLPIKTHYQEVDGQWLDILGRVVEDE